MMSVRLNTKEHLIWNAECNAVHVATSSCTEVRSVYISPAEEYQYRRSQPVSNKPILGVPLLCTDHIMTVVPNPWTHKWCLKMKRRRHKEAAPTVLRENY